MTTHRPITSLFVGSFAVATLVAIPAAAISPPDWPSRMSRMRRIG